MDSSAVAARVAPPATRPISASARGATTRPRMHEGRRRAGLCKRTALQLAAPCYPCPAQPHLHPAGSSPAGRWPPTGRTLAGQRRPSRRRSPHRPRPAAAGPSRPHCAAAAGAAGPPGCCRLLSRPAGRRCGAGSRWGGAPRETHCSCTVAQRGRARTSCGEERRARRPRLLGTGVAPGGSWPPTGRPPRPLNRPAGAAEGLLARKGLG